MEEAFKRNRVVVTGIGTISSLGVGIEPFWENILAAKAGSIMYPLLMRRSILRRLDRKYVTLMPGITWIRRRRAAMTAILIFL